MTYHSTYTSYASAAASACIPAAAMSQLCNAQGPALVHRRQGTSELYFNTSTLPANATLSNATPTASATPTAPAYTASAYTTPSPASPENTQEAQTETETFYIRTRAADVKTLSINNNYWLLYDDHEGWWKASFIKRTCVFRLCFVYVFV